MAAGISVNSDEERSLNFSFHVKGYGKLYMAKKC